MEPIPAKSFGKGHIVLIAVSILILSAATYMSGGFTLGNFGVSDAESAAPPVTAAELAAEAKQKVASEYAAAESMTDQEAIDALTEAQLAELDPNYVADDGSVLGASTDPTAINVEQLLDPANVNSVVVNSYVTNDSLLLNLYATQMHGVENSNNALGLLSVMAGRDAASLTAAAQKYDSIIQQLQNLKVPSQFVTFHRYKLMYYVSLATMARSMTQSGPTNEASVSSQLFFSLSDKMDALSSQLMAQYGVPL